MKKIFFLSLLFSFTTQFVLAQLTPAEIQKKAEEAIKKAEQLMNDPKVKAAMEKAKQVNQQPATTPKADSLTGIPENKIALTKPRKIDTANFLLPVRNDKYLNALPIRTFNRTELVSYLHNLNSKLTELLRSSYGKDIQNIPDHVVTKTGTSIGLWINGELEKSPLVALKGAELNPDNVTLLNNVGGILTSCGLGVNAIPILQYVLEKQPGNNMILNNLGQAYLSLGDDKKAEQYLLQCISSYNYYPDANLALACIYNSRGNKSSALNYVENSLRGAWSPRASNLLYKLKPDAKLMDYIRHRYKQPEHFNIHKYPLLPQCRKVDDTRVLKPQYDAYDKMLFQLGNKYDRLEREEKKIAEMTSKEIWMKAIKNQHSPYRPFGIFANAVLTDMWVNEYRDRLIHFEKYNKVNYREEIKKLKERYAADKKIIDDKWEPELEKIGEGHDGKDVEEAMCKEINELGNTYLPQFARLTEDYQLETMSLYKNYLNDWSYWSYIASIDDPGYKVIFYNLVNKMIGVLKDINTTEFIFPCINEESQSGKADALNIEEPDCFLKPKIVLPLGAVNLEISCEAFKLEAGEGLIGKIEYDRAKGEVTLAFGPGGSVPKVFFENKNLGLEFGVEAEAKSQFYITFDKTGPTDLGVLWEAEMKAVAGIGEVKVELGLEEEVLTAGFGSGVQMKEGGALKALIDRTWYVQPDAKQINKNVPLYKK